ncbi:MAG: ParA family protein, partial [Gemmatimonadales bacterium]
RNVRLAEAPSFGKPILLYDIGSIGAQTYLNVAEELIARTVNRSSAENIEATRIPTLEALP